MTWKVFMSKTTLSLWKYSLDGLASSIIMCLTLSDATKILLYCTEYNGPTTLTPTNEDHGLNEGKTLYEKMTSLLSQMK